MLMRGREFSSPLTALLAGIAITPVARAQFEDFLDDTMRSATAIDDHSEEIIIGGGLHAAVYAMNRPKGKRLLALENRRRIGGILAQSRAPFFYLNSRDRPTSSALISPLLPGRGQPLNMLPGAVLQTSDIGSNATLTNDDLAFVIRANLVLRSRVRFSFATEIRDDKEGKLAVITGAGNTLLSDRVILATGLGKSKPALAGCITFEQFMNYANSPFPLRGIKRAAVVGAKESGNVTVEFLLGLGPKAGNSVINLDYVDHIDWFGQNCLTAEEFERCNRRRYGAIAGEIPRRILPIPGRVCESKPNGGGIRLFARTPSGEFRSPIEPYDIVIFATGFEQTDPKIEFGEPEPFRTRASEPFTATKYPGREIYRIGPCANLPLSNAEASATKGLPDNSAAVWRWAEKTARFARNIQAS